MFKTSALCRALPRSNSAFASAAGYRFSSTQASKVAIPSKENPATIKFRGLFPKANLSAGYALLSRLQLHPTVSVEELMDAVYSTDQGILI